MIDEPEKNLDRDSIERFYTDIKNISDKTIIIATHRLIDEISVAVDRIYRINQGRGRLEYENIG